MLHCRTGIHLPSQWEGAKSQRQQSQFQLKKLQLPGDTVQLKQQGYREWLGGQGREAMSFLSFFWSQATTHRVLLVRLCLSVFLISELGFEVSQG